MKMVQKVTAVLLGLILITACNDPVTRSTNTHVKDLVQSDVFEVLSKHDLDVLVYNDAEEIEGEYLTLATVQVQEISEEWSENTLLDQLMTESKLLGGNGLLITKKNTTESGSSVTKEWQAIAVYAFDRIPLNDQYVSL